MILDQFKLTNRSALIIGGNRGLGIEIGKALAEAGASVAVAARDADKNAEAVSLIEPLGPGKVLGLTCDVLDESQVN
jgi:NAD(P)-dependent dehydrogenase (short-subunit alcohol dehydrogenase family)